MTGSEAIITQNDEIVRGPIEPGLHFKLPFTEKVHEFQMFRVERIQLNFPNTDEYNAIIYWTIQDSKIFFLSTRNKDIK